VNVVAGQLSGPDRRRTRGREEHDETRRRQAARANSHVGFPGAIVPREGSKGASWSGHALALLGVPVLVGAWFGTRAIRVP